MKQINIIYSENAPKPIGPYSQAAGIENLVFFAGQIAIDPATSLMSAGDVKVQTARVCENIKAVLGAAGLDFSDVVKTTCFLTSAEDFTDFNEVYSKYFTSSPARSCVFVNGLPKGARVEIELIAVRR